MSQITMNHLKYILRLPGKIVEALVEQCDHKSDLNYLPTQRREMLNSYVNCSSIITSKAALDKIE